MALGSIPNIEKHPTNYQAAPKVHHYRDQLREGGVNPQLDARDLLESADAFGAMNTAVHEYLESMGANGTATGLSHALTTELLAVMTRPGHVQRTMVPTGTPLVSAASNGMCIPEQSGNYIIATGAIDKNRTVQATATAHIPANVLLGAFSGSTLRRHSRTPSATVITLQDIPVIALNMTLSDLFTRAIEDNNFLTTLRQKLSAKRATKEIDPKNIIKAAMLGFMKHTLKSSDPLRSANRQGLRHTNSEANIVKQRITGVDTTKAETIPAGKKVSKPKSGEMFYISSGEIEVVIDEGTPGEKVIARIQSGLLGHRLLLDGEIDPLLSFRTTKETTRTTVKLETDESGEKRTLDSEFQLISQVFLTYLNNLAATNRANAAAMEDVKRVPLNSRTYNNMVRAAMEDPKNQTQQRAKKQTIELESDVEAAQARAKKSGENTSGWRNLLARFGIG